MLQRPIRNNFFDSEKKMMVWIKFQFIHITLIRQKIPFNTTYIIYDNKFLSNRKCSAVFFRPHSILILQICERPTRTNLIRIEEERKVVSLQCSGCNDIHHKRCAYFNKEWWNYIFNGLDKLDLSFVCFCVCVGGGGGCVLKVKKNYWSSLIEPMRIHAHSVLVRRVHFHCIIWKI